jgi:ABC-type sugar transport system ATPase subunit
LSAEPAARVGAPPVLELRNIRKAYGGVVALSDASLEVRGEGAVHALAGENGSGKSTLLGILSGQLAADSGEMWMHGRRTSFRSPADAIAAGICMVSQETSIAPDLTVGENVLLGRMDRRWWGVDRPASMRTAQTFLARLGTGVDPRERAGDLPPDQLQLVEIARALSMDARVLILDEPTSSLTASEAESLLTVVDDLRGDGVVTIFVSHRMSEVFAIADDVTVLRDGRVAFSGPVSSQTSDSLVAAMLGPAKAAMTAELASGRHPELGETLLEARGLSVPDVLSEVSLSVRAGEVVGLAGLEGAGRAELLECLFGELAPSAGSIAVRGEACAPRGPRDSVNAGVAYLPPDRKTRGLVLPMSIRGNASIVGTLRRPRLAPPDTRLEESLLDRLVRKTTLRMAAADAPVSSLSGGNQQKIALGKWLAGGKDVLLLDEPTRGVDIGAKLEIHALLRELAAEGAAVLVSSSENEELLAVCDRIVVMARQRVVAEVPVTEASLSLLARLSREGVHEPHR